MKALSLVVLLALSSVAIAFNPHHYLWIALNNVTVKTPAGAQAYQDAQELGFVKPLFHCMNKASQKLKICKSEFYYDAKVKGEFGPKYIYIHGDYMSQSVEARGKVIETALKAYVANYK